MKLQNGYRTLPMHISSGEASILHHLSFILIATQEAAENFVSGIDKTPRNAYIMISVKKQPDKSSYAAYRHRNSSIRIQILI
uniref:Uncharacterized protein n=1 Tax=Nelumbo nucifera TaxID=4432 RepID=A0A822XFW7_NELNU|nr:TPA_asm: hypothetical protein HUJ06_019380 [Nelumbo nucifera]